VRIYQLSPDRPQRGDELICTKASKEKQGTIRLKLSTPGSYLMVAERPGYLQLKYPFYMASPEDGFRDKFPRMLRPEDVPEGMVYVPGGSFIMGGDEEEDELPRRVVLVKGFLLDRTEVSRAEYAEFCRRTGHRTPQGWREGRPPEGTALWPVTGVSWHDAVAFARWKGKRLPTEEEWEKAARGADGRIWPWGNKFIPQWCNTHEMEARQLMPVGSIPEGESPYGCLDMAGNAWEWTASDYLPYPGNENYSRYYGRTFKVIRGGCYRSHMGQTRCANRYRELPDYPNNLNLGFRCAKDLPPEKKAR
jgi:iron(II)-dependent oxidoreductase